MTDKLRMYKNKKYICFLGDKDVDSHRSCICYMLGAPFDFSAFARLWCYSSPTWWSTEICKNSFHSYGIHEQVSAFMTCFVSFAKKGVSTRNKSYLNNSTKDSKHTCTGLGKGNGALKSSRIKVQILWEGHKIWRNLPPWESFWNFCDLLKISEL